MLASLFVFTGMSRAAPEVSVDGADFQLSAKTEADGVQLKILVDGTSFHVIVLDAGNPPRNADQEPLPITIKLKITPPKTGTVVVPVKDKDDKKGEAGKVFELKPVSIKLAEVSAESPIAYQLKDGEAEPKGVITVAWPAIQFMEHDTEEDIHWRNPRKVARLRAKDNEVDIENPDIYLAREEGIAVEGDNPGETVRIRILLPYPCADLEEAGEKHGLLSLETHSKFGNENPPRVKVSEWALDLMALPEGIAHDLVADGRELRLSIPYNRLPADFGGDGAADKWEGMSSDHVEQNLTDLGSNGNDGEAFDANDQAWRGYLRYFKKPDGTEKLPELPEIHIRKRFVKAGGHLFLRSAFRGVEGGFQVIGQDPAYIQNQADILYFSGHCNGGFASSPAIADLTPANVAAHWGQDVDVAINAACHMCRLYVATGEADDETTENVDESKVPSDVIHLTGGYAETFSDESPGKEWAGALSKGKVILGYRFRGPRDAGAPARITTTVIIARFMSEANAGNLAAAAICEKWMSINSQSTEHWSVNGLPGKPAQQQRGWNAVAIDIEAKKCHYFHHGTWDGELPAPERKSVDY